MHDIHVLCYYASWKITNWTFATNSMAHTSHVWGINVKSHIIAHFHAHDTRHAHTSILMHADNSASEQKSGQFLGGTIISKRGLVVVRAHVPLYIIGGWLSWGYDEGTALNNADECMHMLAWWMVGLYFVTNTSNHSR